MATFACGHARTAENTTKRQCRTCKAAKQRARYAADPAFAESERARARANYDALEGVSYSLKLLQARRACALYRRRRRALEA